MSQYPGPYGVPQPPAGYGPGSAYGYGYGAPQRGPSGSTIALTIVAGLVSMTCYFSLAGVPALILAIVALVRADSDPEGSARLTKIGWIVFGVVSVLIVVGIVLVGVVLGMGLLESGGSADLPDGSV